MLHCPTQSVKLDRKPKWPSKATLADDALAKKLRLLGKPKNLNK
jgi:hypothetical protein